jgi:hypothetical protein
MKKKNCLSAFALASSLSLLMFSQAAVAQSWAQLKGPIGRDTFPAVFDPNSGRMIIFGGSTNNASDPDLNEVWWLVNPGGLGLGWVEAQPTGSAPAPRAGASAVYDSVNDRMTIFGGGLGQASPCANDVWVLNHAAGVTGTPTWIQLSPSGGPPSPRLRFSAVYDPTTNEMIAFGGNDCFSTNFSDVWILSNANGLGGTPTWTELSPSGASPGGTEDQTAVYDSGSNSMIVFGGTIGGVNSSSEVWLLSNANGNGGAPSWSQLSPSGSPPLGRDQPIGAYDQANKRMMIYGGNNSTQTFSDTWVLSNADGTTGTPTWTKLKATGPPARTAAAGIYNPATNQMTVFGGYHVPTDDSNTFVLSGANGLP